VTGLAARIALVALIVATLGIGVIAVGVLVLGADAFERLMVEHGETVVTSRAMFDASVRVFFLISVAAAVLVSAVLASLLARWLSRPLARIAGGARHIAEGDFRVRVPREGPEEIASVADTFNLMAERLEEQERLRSEFIANAAHELRTPLTNLVGYLEGLRDGVVAPSREAFVSLREEVERLVRLSRSLDALAHGDLDDRTGAIAEIDLARAITDAVELVQPSFDRRAIVLAVDVPGSLHARANADHLAQVLANLLQNAVRYTPDHGRVAIAAESRSADVLVTVTNTGEGIPAGDLPKVFERFYRVEKSRARARGGAGIGLAIVKQLVERAGGRVGAESSDGVTRFWFSLPSGVM
jgi:signal transduction histidine kinase